MKKILVFVLLLLFYSIPAHAFIITPDVDHCAYQDGKQWFGDLYGSICSTQFNQSEGIAYLFSLDHQMTITGAEGLIYSVQDKNTQSSLELALYGTIYNEHRGGYIPDLNNKLLSRQVMVLSHFNYPQNKDDYAWEGFSGEEYHVLPGQYWLAFENAGRGMQVTEGVRITGHTPEPATLLIFGMGFAMIRGRRWLKK